MKEKTYWVIKRLSTGKFISFGRYIQNGKIYETGMPNFYEKKIQTKRLCLSGEIPVEIKISEVKNG
jgi:hypothetical protein